MANHLAYTDEMFIAKLEARFGNRFDYSKVVYQGRRKDITVICKIHGAFDVNPRNFLKSATGCYKCGRLMTKEKFLEKSVVVHGDRYDYSKVNFVDSIVPVEIVCSEHGSFWISPYRHYAVKQSGCPQCAHQNNRLGVEEFIRQARIKHGTRYDYSRVSYNRVFDRVVIGCPVHGFFKQQPRIHLMGSGCKRCFLERRRHTTERFIALARKIHGNLYDYSQVCYVGNKTKVDIICPRHGLFKVTPNAHLTSKAGCMRCKESKGETEIRVFLEKKKINFFQEYRVEPFRYRYDFYLPDYNLLIEHQGHQHFRPVERFGGREAFVAVCKRDRKKAKIAKQKGYHLLVTDYRLRDKGTLVTTVENYLRQLNGQTP